MKYVCEVCGYVYDPAVGDPDHGFAPGTKWEDIPADWVCPVCGVGKDQFKPAEQIVLFENLRTKNATFGCVFYGFQQFFRFVGIMFVGIYMFFPLTQLQFDYNCLIGSHSNPPHSLSQLLESSSK